MQVAHPHSGSSSTWFLVELEFGNVGFWGEGKTGVPGEKPLGARERTNNKRPLMASNQYQVAKCNMQSDAWKLPAIQDERGCNERVLYFRYWSRYICSFFHWSKTYEWLYRLRDTESFRSKLKCISFSCWLHCLVQFRLGPLDPL